MTDNVRKITINVTEENLQVAKNIANSEGTNVTTVINSAIRLKKMIKDAQDRGGKILIEESNGSMKQIVFR